MQTHFHDSVARTTTPSVRSTSSVRRAQQFISEAPAAQLNGTELQRRLWHMLPGLLPFMLASADHQRPLPWGFLVMISAGTMLLTAAAIWCYRRIARDGETNWTLNALSFSAIALPPLFLFPAHPELAAVVVTVLSFGDGSATLFGLWLGRKTLPWNKSKTWVGFFGFFVGALPLATLAYWDSAIPSVSIGVAMICVLPAVLLAQFVESMPGKGTDNFRVGAAAIVGMVLMQTTMFGWP